jgi:hypothetical protein
MVAADGVLLSDVAAAFQKVCVSPTISLFGANYNCYCYCHYYDCKKK